MAADRESVPPERETLATAVGLYALGEYTLGQAAEHAGVSRFAMRDTLTDLGFEVHLGGPRDVDDAKAELDALSDLE